MTNRHSMKLLLGWTFNIKVYFYKSRSLLGLPLHPGHTKEVVSVTFKFTANQSLIIRNFKFFSSSTFHLDITGTIPHLYHSFFVVVKVYLADNTFIFVDDALNTGDFFGWVNLFLTFEEVNLSSLASLTITKSYLKCWNTLPLNLC